MSKGLERLHECAGSPGLAFDVYHCRLTHKSLVLIASAQKPPYKANVVVSNGTRGINVGLRFYIHPYVMYASIEGSGSADLSEHSLLDNAISTKNSWTDSYMSHMTLFQFQHLSI